VSDDYDLVVIGGGAAGLVAAREGRRRGARVVLVQEGPIGGDCTFHGCVPSKALLAAAAAGCGFAEAMDRVHRAVERIAATEDAPALARHGIEVMDGSARLSSPDTVVVDGRLLRTRTVVLATGARPIVPPVAGLDEVGPLTSDTLWASTRRPDSLVVLGGGPMGCELAQAFARFGTRVTLVEQAARVLAGEEPEASAVIARSLTAAGVRLRTGTSVVRAERAGDGQVQLHLDDATVVTGDDVLVAAGRAPSTGGLGVEDVGLVLDARGAVVVDRSLATSVPGIWAAGDVTGILQLTHAAGRMGWVAATNALSRLARVRGFRFDPSVVPWAVFTTPEVGRVGLTEAQAARQLPGARVAHLPLSRVDRAIAAGAEDGFIRLIAAPRPGIRHLAGGRLVGATMVAPTGGDLVHEAALALQTRMFVGRLAQTVHAYPTWSGAVQQAALQFFGESAGLRARPARPGPD
jgi:pyruvate/2-oxoglutarate dehydrogenase complex dihydrolipoamide dehydrogenase (E3) component